MNRFELEISKMLLDLSDLAHKDEFKQGKDATISKYGTLHYKKGTFNGLTDEARALAWKGNSMKADLNVRNLAAIAFIKENLISGKKPNYTQLAISLNENGYKTSRFKKFTTQSVKRLVLKINE